MFKAKKPALICLFCILSLALFSGCQYAPSQPPPESKPIDVGRFSDIPVPAKFKLDAEKSFVFENPAIRAGVLLYSGSGKVAAISTFYRENMPQNGWKFVSGFEMKEAVLNFQKEGWNCVVSIKSEDFSTKIRISVGPTESHPEIKGSDKGFKDFK